MKNEMMISNLRASARDRKSIKIAGGVFSPAEQEAAAVALNERNHLREILEQAAPWLGMAIDSGAFDRCALPNAPKILMERIRHVLGSFPR